MLIVFTTASVACYATNILSFTWLLVLNAVVFSLLELVSVYEFVRFGRYLILLMQYPSLASAT